MKKFNLSAIMKRAWELVKKSGETISSALKKAWREAKSIMEITRDYLIAELERLADTRNSFDNGFNYRVKVNDWENYGKSRTYLSLIETRKHSKHYVTKKYGYFDNQTHEYMPTLNVFKELKKYGEE